MENISNSLAQKASILSNLKPETYFSLHLAARKYESGQFSEAAQLLEQILQKSPYDVAAKIYLSKTYSHLGKYQLAVLLLKSASEKINSLPTYNFYLKQIELNQGSETNNFQGEDINILTTKISGDRYQDTYSPIDDSGEYEKLIVSETLAKIYISQGEIKEAIQIYEKLIEEKPENKEKYLFSIAELKSRIED